MRRAWIVLAAVALAGAGCQAPTELLVAFDFEPSLYPHATSIEASVFRYDGDERVFVQRNTLLIDDTTSWPRYFLRAVQSTPSSHEIFVVAEATLEEGDSTRTLDQSARVAYSPGESRQIIVRFDDSCGAPCPEPLRCWEGACVERCLAGELVDSSTEASSPVACGQPCEAPGLECADGLLLECVDGVRRLREQCELGCSAPDQCDVVRASNLGVALAAATLGELRAPAGMWVALRDTDAEPSLRVTNKQDGAVEDLDLQSGGPLTAFGRPVVTPRGDPPRGIEVRIETVTFGGQDHEFLVIEVGDLIVEPDAELALGYSEPVVFIVHGVAIIEGTVRGDDGRAGARAGAAEDGGHSGGRSGGGGGGGLGTRGGDGGGGGGGAFGGAGGEVVGEPHLVPLTSGATGGRGGGPADAAGAGGGGVQITAATGICVGPTGQLRLRGQDGPDATATAGAGGGGSGGAVLLEAPVVYVMARPSVSPAIDVRGGDGGRGAGSDGEPDSNTGGEGDLTGDGGADGGVRSSTMRGSGGGGGAGRVRINTVSSDVVIDRPCPFVESPTPTSGIEGLISSPPTESTLSFGSLSACHPSSCGPTP